MTAKNQPYQKKYTDWVRQNELQGSAFSNVARAHKEMLLHEAEMLEAVEGFIPVFSKEQETP